VKEVTPRTVKGVSYALRLAQGLHEVWETVPERNGATVAV
jgi:hypothetical protein